MVPWSYIDHHGQKKPEVQDKFISAKTNRCNALPQLKTSVVFSSSSHQEATTRELALDLPLNTPVKWCTSSEEEEEDDEDVNKKKVSSEVKSNPNVRYNALACLAGKTPNLL